MNMTEKRKAEALVREWQKSQLEKLPVDRWGNPTAPQPAIPQPIIDQAARAGEILKKIAEQGYDIDCHLSAAGVDACTNSGELVRVIHPHNHPAREAIAQELQSQKNAIRNSAEDMVLSIWDGSADFDDVRAFLEYGKVPERVESGD